jgi:hypothetical protein
MHAYALISMPHTHTFHAYMYPCVEQVLFFSNKRPSGTSSRELFSNNSVVDMPVTQRSISCYGACKSKWRPPLLSLLGGATGVSALEHVLVHGFGADEFHVHL